MSKRFLDFNLQNTPSPKRSTLLARSTFNEFDVSTFRDIYTNVLRNQETAIDYCRSKNPIANEKNCPKCDRSMSIESRSDSIDGYWWECSNSCKGCVSIRTDTWFAKSKLSID
ncbi:unnamed protein product [Brachionus calyciflorus]|uniref:Uncharacterized protein n=1 Tax=Brachionus calyciflorus TaxID=104777 RepID=A0A814G768_9BILA|nr:unnamed protein product [Brachionus calyciflorus]